MRIGVRSDIVVGRVGGDGAIVGLALDRVAPFGPFGRGERQARIEHGGKHVDEGHLGDDAEKQLGRHVGDGAHQHAAGAAALGDDAALGGEACCREIFARGDEVGEAVHLLLALALAVPAIALVLAAADMGDGIDEAAVDEAQRIGGEAGRDRHAVGAIAVEQQRRGAVELGVLAIEQRDRDGLTVLRGRHDPARHVSAGIVAARNFLRLA